jgi:hypothetical protein
MNNNVVCACVSYVGVGKNEDTQAIHHLKIMRPKWGKVPLFLIIIIVIHYIYILFFQSTLMMDGFEYQSLQECVERGRERDILLIACDTTVPLV